MKSMILKDLYNLSHNAKQLLALFVFLAVCMLPSGGMNALSAELAIISGMMIVTTFSFDERSKWEKYALIMPITRKEYVLAKYVNCLFYGLIGVALGALGSIAYGVITGKLEILAILLNGGVGVLVSFFMGSVMIPLVIRFGTEHARMILLGSVAVPALLVLAVYKSAAVLGEALVIKIIGGGLALLVVWLFVSPFVSIRLFAKKEF